MYRLTIVMLVIIHLMGCKQNHQQQITKSVIQKELLPFILQSSTLPQYWQLNHKLSDEFNSTAIDTAKWNVQGINNYSNNWKGNAPSQFKHSNIYLDSGILVIQSAWDPNYKFSEAKYNGIAYENVTTGKILSKHDITHGFIEIKAKIPPSKISNIFGVKGQFNEFQIFEQYESNFSSPQQSLTLNSIQLTQQPIFNKVNIFNLPLEVALSNDFHIYGCEWNAHEVKLYFDGKLIYKTQKDQLLWSKLNNTLKLYASSETNHKKGLPNETDLPSYYEIDYIRVWNPTSFASK
ncbi:family 16 glycosylhydrolase [Flammeovirga agarivorans]|nr:family 16 glycosylhydrolase [Flammeovirga agarivorans]